MISKANIHNLSTRFHLFFVSYDASRPAGERHVGNVNITSKSCTLPIKSHINAFYTGGAITSGWQGHDYELWGANLGYGLSSGRIAADHIAARLH